MTRVQLRPIRTDAEDADLYRRTYPDGYRHDRWPDHVERVGASVELIRRYASLIHTAADLSCGDGAIVKGIASGLKEAYLGDLNGVPLGVQASVVQAGCPVVRAVGDRRLPESLWCLPEREEPVDLLVLSETLEHVPDPDRLLEQATSWSRYLFLSTPVDEPAGTGNVEHYWGWGQDDIHELLQATGWNPLELKLLTPESTRNYADAYTFQLWMAVRA